MASHRPIIAFAISDFKEREDMESPAPSSIVRVLRGAVDICL